MIIIMKPGASKEAIHNVTCQIETRGLQVHLSEGREVTIVGVVGDKSLLNGISFEIADGCAVINFENAGRNSRATQCRYITDNAADVRICANVAVICIVIQDIIIAQRVLCIIACAADNSV